MLVVDVGSDKKRSEVRRMMVVGRIPTVMLSGDVFTRREVDGGGSVVVVTATTTGRRLCR